MLDPKLIEAIEVCRPGSRDIDGPELAALANSLTSDPQVRSRYDAVQQLDCRMTSVMHEIPVPTGLADRILSRLAATSTSQGNSAAMAVAAGTSAASSVAASNTVLNVPSSVEAPSGPRPTRRRSIAAGLGLAACLLLAVGLAIFGHQPGGSPSTVTEKAIGWYEQLGDGWQPMSKAPKGFSLPKGIGGAVGGWQWVAKNVATSGVVYDLGQGGAVLFVVKATSSELPLAAPRTPQSMTAGFAIGAWRSGGLMYVLVVRGNQRDYQKQLGPVQPLA